MVFSEENEEVLDRMRDDGDDLTKPRDINYSVVFPNEAAANTFASQFASENCSVVVEKNDLVKELPWDVTVSKHMIPRNESITAFEMYLADIAAPYGGRNDGWGCIQI